ncbi:MAG: SulP family inorganic anion transporter [Acidimicrobiales bacterium]
MAKPEGENTAAVAARAAWRAVDGAGTAWSLVIVAMVVATMVALPRLHKGVPASLAAVVAATVVAEAADLAVGRIGALPGSLPAPSLPDLSNLSRLTGAVLAVAALGGLESLLSAKVADGMVDAPPHDPNRELFGQGLANIASPLFGGMPPPGPSPAPRST